MLIKELLEGMKQYRSAAVVPKKKKETTAQRRAREMKDHKFSDSIGGDSSNYRK